MLVATNPDATFQRWLPEELAAPIHELLFLQNDNVCLQMLLAFYLVENGFGLGFGFASATGFWFWF
jgi:hypothetical protein